MAKSTVATDLETIKEKRRAACRAWKAKYPERYKAAQKKWYDSNREAKTKYSSEYSKQRRANDPDWHEETNRRATEHGKRMWKTDPEHRREVTNRSYQYNYGISLEDVESMAEAQNGQCALCKKVKKLTVDHDHVTGKVRELLCHGCNGALGKFADSVERLQGAIDYLIKHRQRSDSHVLSQRYILRSHKS